MFFNPTRSTKLRNAHDFSRRKLQTHREHRVKALKEYVGQHYGDGGSARRVPINFLELACSIYVRQLAARSPKTLITSKQRGLRPHAMNFELAMDECLEELKFERTMRLAVLNAMFGISVAKVGLEQGGSLNVGGEDLAYGKKYVDVVDEDDWVMDMTANRYDQIQYCGNRYRMIYEELMESKEYTNTRKLQPTDRTSTNEQGDERVETLSKGSEAVSDGELFDTVELWDYYIPRENLVVTYCWEMGDQPIKEVEWQGPLGNGVGMYHMLGFADVPNNIVMLPPRALWMDLHELANALFRKLGQQAERQKENTIYRGSSEEVARSLQESADGDMLRCDDPAGINRIKSNGIDPNNLAFTLQLRDLFAYFGGNLDALGGLSPQADTLGQDELLHSSANQRVADMQDRVNDFSRGVVRDLAHWEFDDPIGERHLRKNLPGFQVGVNVRWSPETRVGHVTDYTIDIDNHSMQHSTAAMKLRGINNYIQQMIVPLAPFMQAQGYTINMQHLNDTISRLGNLPEVDDLLMFQGDPLFGQAENQENGMPKPTTTTRNYNRKSQPSATRQGKDNAMVQALMGVRQQQSELSQTGRQTG